MTPQGGATAAGALLAPAARRWLAARPAARVLHLFESAAYLIDPKGRVLLLARPPLGPGPFTLLLAPPAFDFLETMTLYEAVTSSSANLTGERWSIDVRTARAWRARPGWGSLRRKATRVIHGLSAIRQALVDRGPRGAFGRILLGWEAPEDTEGLEWHLQARAAAGVTQLAEAVHSGLPALLGPAASALAGLGSGFTPAGDDFLMGVMLAQWATRPPEKARRVCRPMARAASARTTTASAAWLQAAAEGEASWSWHRMVEALAAADTSGIRNAAGALLETGHTSGEDALVGFLQSIQPGL